MPIPACRQSRFVTRSDRSTVFADDVTLPALALERKVDAFASSAALADVADGLGVLVPAPVPVPVPVLALAVNAEDAAKAKLFWDLPCKNRCVKVCEGV